MKVHSRHLLTSRLDRSFYFECESECFRQLTLGNSFLHPILLSQLLSAISSKMFFEPTCRTQRDALGLLRNLVMDLSESRQPVSANETVPDASFTSIVSLSVFDS